jgi:hypothetical protein
MTIKLHSFTQYLWDSLSRAADDRRVLARVYDVPVNHIIKTVETTDRCGIDYLVALPEGIRGVDVKRRSAGSARY